ncbi:hypothetical protein AMTRI_Chr09g19150 [Amborella trichopoda]
MHFWGMFELAFFTLSLFVPSSYSLKSILTSSLSSLYPYSFFTIFCLILVVGCELLLSFSSPPCWVSIQSYMCTIPTLAVEPSVDGTCVCMVLERMDCRGLRWLYLKALGVV